jgi:hypothetical protein
VKPLRLELRDPHGDVTADLLIVFRERPFLPEPRYLDTSTGLVIRIPTIA